MYNKTKKCFYSSATQVYYKKTLMLQAGFAQTTRTVILLLKECKD